MTVGVYIIQQGKAGLIKIGMSRDILVRVKTLRHLWGGTMWLLGIVEGGRREEMALHKRFARLRYGGEWFEPGAELLAYIDTLPCPRARLESDPKLQQLGLAYRMKPAKAETT